MELLFKHEIDKGEELIESVRIFKILKYEKYLFKKIFKKNFYLALKAFNSVLKKMPKSLRSIYGKAVVYDKLSEAEENNEKLIKSIKLYKKIFSSEFLMKTKDLNLHLVAGKRLIDRLEFLGENQEAIEYLKILIDLFPNEIQFENELGVAYLLSNNINLAREKFKNVLNKSPNNPVALVHYGFILKQVDKKFDDSIEYLKRGIDTLDKKILDGRFFYHLGDALQRVNKTEEVDIYLIKF